MRTEDLTGREYGYFTVLGFDRSVGGKRYWNCRCICGNTRSVMTSCLINGRIKSCGCMNKTNRIDLTGQRFGRLVVLSQFPTEKGEALKWECVCDCGNSVVVTGSALRYGTTRSCGCLRAEHEAPKEDAYHRQRLYGVWAGMMQRCFYEKHKEYHIYGGRGITVCNEWKDYAVFRDWAYANGYDENHDTKSCSLDRIDVNGNYCPDNCRWVDMKTQSRNTRRNFLVKYKGELRPASEVAEREGVKAHTLIKRLKSGYSLEEALSHTRIYRPITRPVICVELNRRFDSILDASGFVNVRPSAINHALSHGGRSGGYHWRYADK